ncbi:MAG: acetate--CoA ligase family protein [Actinobacteria bacterium]|nr:acetate--CoA ligase family protein [Actinomycetota bacterium]
MADNKSSKRDSIKDLESWLFKPGSLAVVGASAHTGKVGNVVLTNILEAGYPGKVFPVNPKSREIAGISCYPDVNSIPGKVDMAVIIVPARFVPEVVSQCAEKGVKGCIVISAGFREVGVEGRRLENEMVSSARLGGMRVLGPNCLGVMNTGLPLNATFSRMMSPGGSIGVISQSGAVCTSLLDWAVEKSIGFSKMISLGNGADLSESDLIKALADDDKTKVIAAYLEGVSNGKKFMSELSRATRKKPVVIFKSGTTQAGARAASSHTGALAGSDSAYNAVCRQAEAFRARTMEEFVELASALATQEVPRGPRTAILTNAGGPGIIAADALAREGLLLAPFEEKTMSGLRKHLPEESNIYNPVDVLGDADAERYLNAAGLLLSDRNVDSLLVILAPQAMTQIELTARKLTGKVSGTRKTVFCSFMGSPSMESAVSMLHRAGIPNITYPDEAAHILKLAYQRTVQKKTPRGKRIKYEVDRGLAKAIIHNHKAENDNQVGPEECRSVLDAYGIGYVPFKIAADMEEALETADNIGYPLAMKIVSPQIIHKTDFGGIKLGVKNPAELEDGYEEIISNCRRRMPGAQITGVGIQKMAPEGKELIAGMVRDPQFGPMVMVGLGGIYVETFGDVSFRIAPITDLDAERMLKELKAFRLLAGSRGEAPSDIEAVEETLLRISQLSLENPALSEMDINPLVVYNSGDGCTCLDVRMTLGGS